MENDVNKFHSRPNIDPETNKKIIISSEECGKSVDKSPILEHSIFFGKYNDLIVSYTMTDSISKVNLPLQLDTYIFTLPEELINIILSDISINDLITLYNTNYRFQQVLNNKSLLIKLTNKFGLKQVNNFMELLNKYMKKILRTLNFLSPLYLARTGFCPDTKFYYKNNMNHNKRIQQAIKHGDKVYDNDDNIISDVCKQLLIKKWYIIQYCADKLYNTSLMIIPYKKVTIIHSLTNIIDKYKHGEWYNGKTGQKNTLPNVNNKKYIKINEPSKTVDISADIKGSSLTINDLLFATRALMYGSHLTIRRYKILNEYVESVILEAYIDYNKDDNYISQKFIV